MLLATPSGGSARRRVAPPTNLTVTVGNASVSLRWTASSSRDVVQYRVYRQQTTGSWLSIYTTPNSTTTSYNDTGLTNGTTYSYVVRAVDGAGNVSAPSNTATATPQAAPPPPPPASNCSSPPCWDFVGNTFSGLSYNQVPADAEDLAVSRDGWSVTGARWDESAHDVRTFSPTGLAIGPRPGNRSGRLRENGGGPHGVAITGSRIYAVQARNVVSWDRATWLSYGPSGSTYNGTTLTLPGSGDLLGVAVCGTEAYVVDPAKAADQVSPDTAQVKVVSADLSGGVKRQWTVPRARHLACDREGNLWVLGQRTSSASGRLFRYSPAGSQLAAWDVRGDPMDVAADPSADQVLIADNGPDQRIERYDYAGNQVGAVGVQDGYLAGPTPGLLGPNRFAGPRGVDVDSAGNIYVAQTLNPGSGLHAWSAENLTLIVSKLSPSGSEAYRDVGEWGMLGSPSNDGSRYYVNGVTYGKGSDGRYSPYALNVDGFSGTDPRVADPHEYFDTQEVEPSGHRLIGERESNGSWLRLYRFDGELARWCRTFTGSQKDWFLASTGDVWRARGGGSVSRVRATGFDASGCPTYAAEETMPLPPGLGEVDRVDVDGSTVYVSGYGPSGPFESGFDDWKFSGKLLARFDGLPTSSGWPSRRWLTSVPWGTYPDRPVSISASGDKVAVAYLRAADANRGYIRLFHASDGSNYASVRAPDTYGSEVGWYDSFDSIDFKGSVLSAEANGEDKTVLITPP